MTFTYEEGGEERRVRDAETFSRCKEEVENSYSGQGDQAIVIHLDAQRSLGPRESEEQGEGEEELEELEESGGIPDGGGQSRLLEKVGDEVGRMRSFACKLRCHYEEETIDEVEVDDNTRWIDFLALLRHILKDDATFTYLRRTKEEDEEEEKEEMIQVNNAREFAAFLASLRGSDASMEEIFLVRRESAAFFPSRKESTKRAEIKHGVQDALRQLSSEATSDWPRVDDEERDSHVSEEEELEKERAREQEREGEREREREGEREREREQEDKQRERMRREKEEGKRKRDEMRNQQQEHQQEHEPTEINSKPQQINSDLSELTVELAEPFVEEQVKVQAGSSEPARETAGERGDKSTSRCVDEEDAREERYLPAAPVEDEGASPDYGNDFEEVRDEEVEEEEEEEQRSGQLKASGGLDETTVDDYLDEEEDPFQGEGGEVS